MAEAFKFELVSPERLLVSEQVESVVIPGAEGEMTVMALHAPVMTTIKPGVVTVKTVAGKEERYVVFGGFADIVPSGCTLLAESAVAVGDIDRADVARRIQEAKEDVADAKDDQARSKAEQFLSQLTTLEGAILPA
ncbi:MAG: F0F1 ATP synthase subunit epsilon [Mesorhizobium sp.]|uniref:F0F1 ATP synthase subunit epsilon n=1 Tax=unclassified Mesorhizobium TaxID=325217 RepID=UPI000F7508F7|nr:MULTISPECIES: F0F1 ATP synthase subunit epsilon [unclassified Mesorhizobium]AZO50160.1 F0F1 ATP synthase subunit epsilon [Mesorhizobium sp. M4B.F.Ca.ET.058.02.1.1]RVC41379.1 F0F1 ATP synthase subunit epsilon [Mesorhizobium sp. M4A.F.Ca.ET.090.04.2.1]RVC83265.1 F0F1 ATP synthase subunit epsilon [Mesorhizobium sp. M4A.F.Ca.ET.022.05.2.1]RWC56961.1 MAG: F0F1 ATP synthase subunit epsilon [Mesorhizobium sp.]RWD00766.1 MAG: F0F1 ATP synthase subunit epsilon [Mesorhizobium sp.]